MSPAAIREVFITEELNKDSFVPVMKIVLASKSPRRQELLSAIGIEDYIVKPSAHEVEADSNLPADEMVKLIACGNELFNITWSFS